MDFGKGKGLGKPGLSPGSHGERGSMNFTQSFGKSGGSSEFYENPLDHLVPYVSLVASMLVIAEIFIIFILGKVKLFFPIKYFSISFLSADTLFQLVSASYSLFRLTKETHSVMTLKLFRQFAQGFTSCLSFSTVAILSCDRVIALAWPLHYRAYVTKRKILCVVGATWLGNAVIYFTSIGVFLYKSQDFGDKIFNKSQGRGFQVRELFADNEHTVLTFMLTSYDLCNIIACCILARQIRNHSKKRKERLKYIEKLKTNISSTGLKRTSLGENSSAGNNSTLSKESVLYSADADAAQLANGKTNSVKKLTDVVILPKLSGSEETGYSQSKFQNLTKTNLPKSILKAENSKKQCNDESAKLNKLTVTKIILSVSFIQLCFHLPYIAGLISVLVGRQGTKEEWKTYLEIISRVLLQIGTLPSLYLYVLKLKECRSLIVSMICCCCSKRI